MLKFTPLKGKQVEANFEGGGITSNGGLLLLREIDKRLNLTKRISKCITDSRKSNLVQHDCQTLLKRNHSANFRCHRK